MEKKRTMKKRWVLDQAVRHTIEETWAVFTNGVITPNPALFLARLADLARSNAFLWTEAGLAVQEHATRMVPVGQSLSRSLVLAAVAADIFVGYTTLDERAKWFAISGEAAGLGVAAPAQREPGVGDGHLAWRSAD